MKYWLINYLSPVYLLLRIGLLMGSGMVWFLLRFSTDVGDFFAGAVALILVWNALRPWKTGATVSDIQKKIDEWSGRDD
jgi:hypothetical protein